MGVTVIMNEDVCRFFLGDAFQSFLIAITAAIISSLVTYHLSIKKFRSLKWWELKVVAYQSIIEALHYRKKFFEEFLDEEMQVTKYTDDYKAEVLDNAKKARADLLKTIDVGTFLISGDAHIRLEKYMVATDYDGNSFFDYLDSGYGNTKRCLRDLKEAAAKDLKKF